MTSDICRSINHVVGGCPEYQRSNAPFHAHGIMIPFFCADDAHARCHISVTFARRLHRLHRRLRQALCASVPDRAFQLPRKIRFNLVSQILEDCNPKRYSSTANLNGRWRRLPAYGKGDKYIAVHNERCSCKTTLTSTKPATRGGYSR